MGDAVMLVSSAHDYAGVWLHGGSSRGLAGLSRLIGEQTLASSFLPSAQHTRAGRSRVRLTDFLVPNDHERHIDQPSVNVAAFGSFLANQKAGFAIPKDDEYEDDL